MQIHSSLGLEKAPNACTIYGVRQRCSNFNSRFSSLEMSAGDHGSTLVEEPSAAIVAETSPRSVDLLSTRSS